MQNNFVSKNEEVGLDPQFARAYAGLGEFYDAVAWAGWGEPTALFDKGKALLLKATALEPTDAYAHQVLGQLYIDLSDHDRAFAEFEKALVLNPNDPDVLIRYGGNLYVIGRSPEGVEMIKHAVRLNPRYPPLYDYFADPFYVVGQYDEVVAKIHRTAGDMIIWNYMLLAMAYAQLGRQTDAATAATELLRRYPEFSFERMLSDFGAIRHQATLEHYFDGIHKAGLRDCATQEELQKYPKMTHLAACDAQRVTH
jgi:adenylate cyclase